VPVLAAIMDEASEERRRNVTDALRPIYIIIFVPSCGQKDILALKFHRRRVSVHVTREFKNILHSYENRKCLQIFQLMSLVLHFQRSVTCKTFSAAPLSYEYQL
jgi:hypothetical protein